MYTLQIKKNLFLQQARVETSQVCATHGKLFNYDIVPIFVQSNKHTIHM